MSTCKRLRAAAGIFLCGAGMGVADLVPGVSGGTIALLCGVYRRLVAALRALASTDTWRRLPAGQWCDFMDRSDARFLSLLFAGILTSLLVFASILEQLMHRQLHLLLGFFLGLVLASIIAVARRIQQWQKSLAIPAALGFVIAVSAALSPPAAAALSGPGPVILFLGGAVAICAMILPGISGSYLLLLLGLYPAALSAINDRDLIALAALATGAAAGITAFVHLLHRMLTRFHAPTLALLLGIMAGGLPKLWPWKQHLPGTESILQPNLSPAAFQAAGQNPELIPVLVLFTVGILLALFTDAAGRRWQQAEEPAVSIQDRKDTPGH